LNPPPTTLLLARHGQSTWNAERRWQGQADPPLSDLGREQAALASAAVGSVDLIAASPQRRAFETATIISEAIGIGPVLAVDGLRERSAGSWSGLTKDDIDVRFPGWLEDGRRPDGFEGDDELLARVVPALDAVAAASPGGMVLVVCHGGVIRTVETHLGVDEGRVPNLSGRLLTSNGESWQIGEQIQLIDAAGSTGGDGMRV
jgi:probable phosphoglycerate mutase